jgi:phenylalanine-4-hydroxylase
MNAMRLKPTVQSMDAYTDEDHAVWQTLFNRQMETLQPSASRLYLEAIKTISFRADEIPDFRKVNEILLPLTGWQLTVAPNLVPEQEFFSLLAQRIFPATCWLRRMSELDYLEEPDMFHDVFGHAPLLSNSDYAAFMEAFGKLALKWFHVPEAVELIARIYWYTIEFGMIREDNMVRIFGAGIMSSHGETLHALSDRSAKLPFDIDVTLATGFRKDVLQETYFVINAFSELCTALPGIDRAIEKALSSVSMQHPV